MNQILTLGEVAQYLRVSPSTIYRLVKVAQIPTFRVGRDLRFRRDLIDALDARTPSDLKNGNLPEKHVNNDTNLAVLLVGGFVQLFDRLQELWLYGPSGFWIPPITTTQLVLRTAPVLAVTVVFLVCSEKAPNAAVLLGAALFDFTIMTRGRRSLRAVVAFVLFCAILNATRVTSWHPALMTRL